MMTYIKLLFSHILTFLLYSTENKYTLEFYGSLVLFGFCGGTYFSLFIVSFLVFWGSFLLLLFVWVCLGFFLFLFFFRASAGLHSVMLRNRENEVMHGTVKCHEAVQKPLHQEARIT